MSGEENACEGCSPEAPKDIVAYLNGRIEYLRREIINHEKVIASMNGGILELEGALEAIGGANENVEDRECSPEGS